MAKILCVDDDKDILEMYEVVLTGQGHEVALAECGNEGLKKAAEFKPNLIVLDIIMTDRTDGLHTAYKLRADESLKYIPILMMTSVNTELNQKIGIKDGEYVPVDAFMEKPMKPKAFIAKINELLSLKKEQINTDGSKAQK